MADAKIYDKLKITPLKNSEVEIEAEIPTEQMNGFRKHALKHLISHLTLTGFRKGKVPENIAVKHIGENMIMEESAEEALQKVYPEILADNKIDALGRPEITITKIASGNPLGFKIKTAVLPKISLPDFKSIAQKEMAKKDEIEVTDKEIEQIVEEVRKNYTNAKKSEVSEIAMAETVKQNEAKKEGEKPAEENLPEVNDEFVKKLGAFKNVADFREKIRENLTKEKEMQAREKKRVAMIEELIAKSKIDLPEILVQSELEKLTAQFKDDISRAGAKWEEYLAHIKKTEDDLKKEWRVSAEKKAKLQLILNKIAEEEKITPDEKEVEKESKHIVEHYAGADPVRVKIYVETLLLNEKVLKFLESQI